jgi:hypothetical protein
MKAQGFDDTGHATCYVKYLWNPPLGSAGKGGKGGISGHNGEKDGKVLVGGFEGGVAEWA